MLTADNIHIFAQFVLYSSDETAIYSSDCSDRLPDSATHRRPDIVTDTWGSVETALQYHCDRNLTLTMSCHLMQSTPSFISAPCHRSMIDQGKLNLKIKYSRWLAPSVSARMIIDQSFRPYSRATSFWIRWHQLATSFFCKLAHFAFHR